MDGTRGPEDGAPLFPGTGTPYLRTATPIAVEGFSFSEGRGPHNRGTVVALSEGEGARFRRKGSFFRVTCSPVPWDAHAPSSK